MNRRASPLARASRSALLSLSLTLAFWALAALTAGCTCSARPGRPNPGLRDSGTGGMDGGTIGGDGAVIGRDSGGPVNPCAPGCGPEELCGDEGADGNGLDDDCDGRVDETCACPAVGVTRPCFAGPPDRRDVGTCADGIETCSEFLNWGPCVGGISPVAESCDGADNDCNAITDDLPGCSSAITCPGNDFAAPLSSYTLRGDRVYTGAARSWRWGIGCPASVPAELCPSPASPGAEDTTVYFSASGSYRVEVTVVLEDGSEHSCAWTVHVQGTGLRVELNWDTMLDTRGGTDVDLHLHRWTRNGVDTDWYDDADDCYYANCTPDAFGGLIDWSDHPDTDLSNCENAPHGHGAVWRSRGSCNNPRLDVDTNGTDGACDGAVTNPSLEAFCAPENINVDNPIVGMPYRIMVNYYSDSGFGGTTFPTVNVYCGGALRGAFGRDPLVELRDGEEYGHLNDNWIVADVVFREGACGVDCTVYPLGVATVEGSGGLFDPPSLPFGPAWSCTYNAATRSCD